jgi:midasin
MVLVDGLESLSQVNGQSAASVAILRKDCLDRLDTLATSLGGHAPILDLAVSMDDSALSIGGFGIPRGNFEVIDTSAFRFEAPTTALNAMRVLRGCQLPKAILLEGSPGVGKTSLVSALAAVSGHRLQRINLSDQTDLIDLFGSDLPVEGGQAGEFQWRDAAFLDAMQRGDWVLLDEMNLASQTVLEGLNAVLDHRGTVFIPELGRSFERHPDFRVFAAQNPLQQGGGRKGLPKSFLNRFTKVYLQEHTPEDLLMICRHLYPGDEEIVQKMITFNEVIRDSTMVSRTIGREGSPWEFNLRDLFRWFKLLSARNGLETSDHPVEYLRLIYTQRFRNEKDRRAVLEAFVRIFGEQSDFPRPQATITPSHYQIGHSLVQRSSSTSVNQSVVHQQLDLAESILKCIEMGWLVILSGESGSGKRGLLKAIADGAGRSLGEFAMHPGVDTSEILGSFEQQDLGRLVDGVVHAIANAGKDDFDTSAEKSGALERLRKSAATVKAKPDDDDRLHAFISLARQYLISNGDDIKATAALDHLAKTGTTATGFAWIDGELLTTIRNGGWFLLSNANLCSPSVLDRLNSLCESNGVLVLSEKGSSTGTPEIITPHPDFRLFMTYDPRHGELSRAMRNRGVELCVEKSLEVTGQTASAALADQSLLRSLVLADPPREDGSASDLANLIVSQPARSVALLERYGTLADTRPAYDATLAFLTSPTMSGYRQASSATVSDILVCSLLPLCSRSADSKPIDPSLNANIKTNTPYAIFSSVQLLLRNLARVSELQDWMKLPQNAKSILTLSSRAASGRTRVKMAGSELWGLVAGIRNLLQQELSTILGFDDGSVSTVCLMVDAWNDD